ncbi:hypothetical protein AB0K60_19800 [Thermopolyspora sp. NPDC052614]|uniref:hypothetical protein n=1 Tax=Thermopolyspora sp. NPDC052614 TaxID=3155682 RepID=UPI00341C4D1F
MPRPTDWNAIGLSGDPTPGDPNRLDELLRSVNDLGRVAREIDDAFVAVLNKTDGAFTGQTADALREKISGELRDFVQSFADAFETSAQALNTYITVMRDQQWRADNALEQGRGLPEDDPRREELATTARLAGEAQAEAGKTAGEAIRSAARGIKRPISSCEEFWNIFKWIAVALVLPALIFGGPVALLTIGLNFTLFVKTMVDAANGKADALAVFLAALGIIAPTTRAFPVGQLLSKTIGKGISRGSSHLVYTLTRDVARRAFSSYRFAPGMGRFVLASPNGLRAGPLWILITPLKDTPRLIGTALRNGATGAYHGIRALPGVIAGIPGQVFRTNSPMWQFAGRHLGGAKGLRLILPVDAMEIGAYGLKGALRIGFVERGLKFQYLFGAPLVGALGRGAAAIPAPPAYKDALRDMPPTYGAMALGHNTNFMVNMVRVDPVDLATARRALDDFSLPPGAGGVLEPPPFTRAGQLGATTWRPLGMLELEASLNVATRGLDMPIRELTAIRNGDLGGLTFTPHGVHGDLSPAPVFDVAHGTRGESGLVPAYDVARGTRGEFGLVSVYDVAPGVHAFGVPAVVPAVHAADMGAAGALRTTGNASALQPSALGLLATPSVSRIDTPAIGTTAHLDDPIVHALTANQVNLHLNEFAPRPTAHVAAGQASTPATPDPIPAMAASAAPPPPVGTTIAAGTPPPSPAVLTASTPTPSPASATISPDGPADRVTSAFALLSDGGRVRTTNTPEPAMASGDIPRGTPRTIGDTRTATPPPASPRANETSAIVPLRDIDGMPAIPPQAHTVPPRAPDITPNLSHQANPQPHPLHRANSAPNPSHQANPQPHPLHEANPQPHPLHRADPEHHPLHRANSAPNLPHQANPQPHPLHRANSAPNPSHQANPQPHPLHEADPQPHPLHRADSMPHSPLHRADNAPEPPRRANSMLELGRARQERAVAGGSRQRDVPQVPDGTRLRGPEGVPDRWVSVTIGQDGSRVLRVVDNAGTHQPHLTLVEEPVGTLRVIDTTVNGSYIRYGIDGEPLLTRRPGPDGTFVVIRSDGQGVQARLENATGEVLSGRAVEILPGGSVKVSFTHGPRTREYTVQSFDGRLLRQAINEINKNGRPTRGQYVVDYPAQGRPTWTYTRNPDDPQHGGPASVFHHGFADVSADGKRIRLYTELGGKVKVLERRTLPGGVVIDAFRPTGARFGFTSRHTTWVSWNDSGTMKGHGIRVHDTSGLAWRDYDSHGDFLREFRYGLHKTEGRLGYVIAIKGKGEDAGWTWHRFDGLDRELGSGPRTQHKDDGWTDKLADGTLVQEQWGRFHRPQSAGHYLEYDWDRAAGRPAATWQLQSSQGKMIGAYTALGDGMISVTRWSEQRLPLWVRKAVVGMADPEPALHYLRTDNRLQIHTWVKEGGASPGSGFRYITLDGGFVDLAADGRFVRATTKLYDGGMLKVGDHATPPGYAAPNEHAVPWQEPGRSGYRVTMDPAQPGARADMPIWQDRFRAADDGPWLVTREGFSDGSIRQYRTPYPLPENGGPGGRPGGPWTQRDAHGLVVARQDDWPHAAAPDGPAPARISIEGRGSPDSATWRWTARDDQGNVIGEGLRVSYRGARDPSLPWDDSFRDFAAGALIRETDMLDGGRFVQAWKGTDPATGQERWFVQKYDAAGNVVPYGEGRQVRRWWDPNTRTWGDRWFDGARHFRDEFHPANGGHPQVVREVPPHLSWNDGPLRVREYMLGGGAAPVPGTWKEFDHGIVVRKRADLGDGTFLETDTWRGQWRRYDGTGRLIAQRNVSGWVFERGPEGRMRLTGSEYDFRGVMSDLRGWGRRIRETERLPWGGAVSVDSARFQAALDGVQGLPSPSGGRVSLGEAAYKPYSQLVGERMLLDFGQEFLLEFTANLGINAIIASAQNRPFNAQDALRSLANAAISGGIKSGASSVMHDIRGSATHTFKTRIGSIDSGKPGTMRPYNADKTWRNEWAGNESPARWRGGTYDYLFTTLLNPITSFVNGSMNAAVWGIIPGHTEVRVLSGADALAAGGITALAGVTTAAGLGAVRHTITAGGDGRFWHRYGVTEYLLQAPLKFLEKYFATVFLAPRMRYTFAPQWYQPTSPTSPPPAQPGPGPQADPQPQTEPHPQTQPDPKKQG